MGSISIFGAGFLLGTALIVILPEGISVLMESSGVLHSEHEQIDVNFEQKIFKQLNADPEIKDLDADIHVFKDDDSKNRRLLSKEHGHEHEHVHTGDEDGSGHHHHTHDPIVHSVFKRMGCAVCIGFIFMMIVEKFGTHSHSHSRSYHSSHSYKKEKETESEEFLLSDAGKSRDKDHLHHHHHHQKGNSHNEILSFMIGLLTHSAVDGVALGAVSAEGNADSLSILVFVALMAHKGPAAVSMTAFLKRKLKASGDLVQNRNNIIKQLIAFSLAAPLFAILTFVVLKSMKFFTTMDEGEGAENEMDDMLGYCLLFSGGTFLYVVTLHIIPEIKEWREMDSDGHKDEGLTWTDLLILGVGAVVPSLFQHSH